MSVSNTIKILSYRVATQMFNDAILSPLGLWFVPPWPIYFPLLLQNCSFHSLALRHPYCGGSMFIQLPDYTASNHTRPKHSYLPACKPHMCFQCCHIHLEDRGIFPAMGCSTSIKLRGDITQTTITNHNVYQSLSTSSWHMGKQRHSSIHSSPGH